MDLGGGHDIDVGLDETSGLPLTDERGGGSDNGFCAGDIHGLEEEPSTG